MTARRLVFAAAWLVVSVAAVAEAQPMQRPLRVLLLYAPPPESPAVVEFTHGLRATIRRDAPSHVEFYEEFLDLDRFAMRDRSPQLARYFADKYRGFRLDVIVAVGSSALRFASDRLSEILPGVPVVFALVIENAVNRQAVPANVTGRLTPLPYASILAMARALQPDANQVVIVGGVSPSDSLAVSAALAAVAPFRDRLKLILLRGLSYEAVLDALRGLSRQTIVLLAYLRRDASGQIFTTSEIVSNIARTSAAPVYGHLRNWVGQGIVGGKVVHFGDEGVRTGQLVTRVLRRAPGDPMPALESAPSTYVTDWRQLQRWGLQEDRLPAGAQVLFRQPTPWQRHRAVVLTAVGLFLAQSGLITLLLAERRRRLRAQLAVEDQVEYEQTIAELTTDAARHASNETPRALEHALARIGRYAGARAAVLVEYPDVPFHPPSRLTWIDGHVATKAGPAPTMVPSFTSGDSRLDIALVADDMPIGALELYGANPNQGWSERLVCRLDAAGELIAGAMARARAARAVRRGEELNQAVLASFSAPIAILDSGGTIIRVNDAWRQVAEHGGVDPCRDGFLGENYLDECRRAESRGSESAHAVREGIESVLARRAWPFRYEYRFMTPEERWYELVVDRLDRVDGGAMVTHLDITDRRLSELRAEATRQQVAHMGRVAMVGELAAAVSHELRQPLAAIRANAEAGALLLKQHPPEVGEAREIFMDIVVDDVRASEIIDHIRTLLRNEEPTRKAVSLNEICRQAVHLLQRDAGLRSTRLELALEPRLPSVVGDPVQLQQVVLNLALNAIDAAATSPGDRQVIVGTAGRGGEIEIYVRDSGRGLPPDVEKRLFESFFSTKAKGLGMGLVIARSIVERHHGRMRAENAAEGGAVFRVLLPIANVRSEVVGHRAREESLSPRP